ncbi:MAG: hypothetical protein CO042_00255 [Parcubacteria group bacterium CG_4_9_14_0_2_um_filter_41_8]|nr:MAG: hypothetical protein COV79_02420 [Parcubacteria group bacterium CG11_big_fil_rev_8_21_14_0_20_41_14]PJC41086.1 MAG: hypothetical protein CO042_00255 [Parcubacteria group bacterium CG_4_9_14_0_2_um_filter_41_8]
MGTKYLTAYLFAQPSFAEGMGRTLDIGGVFDNYNESESGKEADALALQNDWRMVGEDMKSAIQEI